MIDTPGLREVQLWAADTALDQTFPEISDLATACRFRDCQHTVEPGCAVLAGIAAGEVAPARLQSLHRLRREVQHLHEQSDPLLAVERKQKLKRVMRAQKKAISGSE